MTPESYLQEVSDGLLRIDLGAVNRCVESLELAYRQGRTVYVIGNGGSAASACHFAQDLAFGAPHGLEGPRLRSLSLCDNVSYLTAVANDLGYERVFEVQLQQFAQPGDVLVVLSISGDSRNVLLAASFAKTVPMTVVTLTGTRGGQLANLSDVRVHVPLDDIAKVESVHAVVLHLIRDTLQGRLKVSPPPSKDRISS